MLRLARILLNVGIVAAVVLLSVYHSHFVASPPYSYTGTVRFSWSIYYIAILVVIAYGFGLPELPGSPRQALVAAAGSAAVAMVAVSAVQLLVGDAFLPRFVVYGAGIVLTPWFLLCAALGSDFVGTSSRDRVLVVSDKIDASDMHEEIERSAERPVVLVGVVPVADAMGDGFATPLVDELESKSANVLVLDRNAQEEPAVVTQAASLHESGIRVRTLSKFYGEWLGMLPMADLERLSLMFDIGELHRGFYGRIKRVMDLVLSTLGMPLLLVAVPLVAVGNVFGNRGPLFYRQERVGKGGVTFTIIKFRTMRDDPEKRTDWTSVQDSRITPFGQLLRVSHLDELPQVINILRGDLSVVGPRPEQSAYVEQLAEVMPYYRLRHLVSPGLTGWAQVKFGYAGDETDSMEKLQYDFFYLRNQRLSLDLRIIGRTIRSVFGGGGR